MTKRKGRPPKAAEWQADFLPDLIDIYSWIKGLPESKRWDAQNPFAWFLALDEMEGKGDAKSFGKLLRSGGAVAPRNLQGTVVAIPAMVAEMLADMLDPPKNRSTQEARLVLKKKSDKMLASFEKDTRIFQFIVLADEVFGSLSKAIALACEEFGSDAEDLRKLHAKFRFMDSPKLRERLKLHFGR
jgi:hypothetical protein